MDLKDSCAENISFLGTDFNAFKSLINSLYLCYTAVDKQLH